jgi:hypothetical protein
MPGDCVRRASKHADEPRDAHGDAHSAVLKGHPQDEKDKAEDETSNASHESASRARAPRHTPHSRGELWIFGVEGALHLLKQALLVIGERHDDLLMRTSDGYQNRSGLGWAKPGHSQSRSLRPPPLTTGRAGSAEQLQHDVQLGGNGGESCLARMTAHGTLEVEQSLRSLRIAVDESARQQVGEEPDPVHRPNPYHTIGRPGEHRKDAGLVEAPWERIVPAAPASGVIEQTLGLRKTSGQCPGEECAEPLGHENADKPAGPQHSEHVSGGELGIVDMFEDAVTQDQICRSLADGRDEGPRVTLESSDAIRDRGIGNPPLQGRESVGAGIDHGDPVPELSDRNGEPAGSATDVDHVENVTPDGGHALGNNLFEGLPQEGGPDRRPWVGPKRPAAGPEHVFGHGSSPCDGTGMASPLHTSALTADVRRLRGSAANALVSKEPAPTWAPG